MGKSKRLVSTPGRSVANGVVMALVLFFLLGTIHAGYNHRIADISVNLGRALNKALEFENDTYTGFDATNVTYNMSVTFDPKGMTGLYNITTFFMDLIQPKGIFPDDIELPVDDAGNIDLSKILEKFPSMLKHYAGILALTIIGLLFIVLMPLVGFIFCCCRCCGNCGARSQPFDKKHDLCKKVVLAMLLICVATLLLFGVVCAFVSNQHIQEGTEELPNELHEAVADLRTYLNHTDHQIGTLLVVNFNELKNGLMSTLRNSATIISDELTKISNATSFTHLYDFVNGLGKISTNLNYMKRATNELRVNASQLSDGLRRVKNELLSSLNACALDQCKKLLDQINKMKTTMDFDKLPDVSATIESLSNIIENSNLNETINKGMESFRSIEENIKKSIGDNIPQVEVAIESAGTSLEGGYNNISAVLKDVNKMLTENGDPSINQADHYIKEYSKYRYYVGITEASILLVVIICMTFGLMCGICGKRPGGYDDDCCNKGAGSRFLMMGVGIMFLFSFLLMLITLVYFLSGMVTQRVVCDTLRPQDNKSLHDNRLFSLLDKMAKNKLDLPNNLSSVIEECHHNQSVYKVLKLESKLNVSNIPSYLEEYGITDKMNAFKDKINLKENITIIDDDTRLQIEELKNSGIGDINFDRFGEILEHNITSIDLNDMAAKLNSLAPLVEKDEAMAMALKQNAMYLQMYQKNLVDPMISTADELKVKSKELEQALSLNHEGEKFEDVIDKVELEITVAQNYINFNSTGKMKELAEEFAKKFEGKLLKYIYYVANRTQDDVGKCGPLSNIYNATLVATCDKIFHPWNGFWVCVGWCLILFIPAIILSVKLATLYQKSETYPGPLVEAEYLYDAYADRDNIPLSNVPHKKGKKKKHSRHADMYDTRGGYPGDGSRGDMRAGPPRERDAPGGSSHPDTRYADMAPKHWDDYPNGGPPQYQSAPMATEYERPPPYYYPGPGTRP